MSLQNKKCRGYHPTALFFYGKTTKYFEKRIDNKQNPAIMIIEKSNTKSNKKMSKANGKMKIKEVSKMRNAYYAEMTDEELAKAMRDAGEWVPEQVEELVFRADMEDEYEKADGDTFEAVVYKAAEKLGVEI